MVGISQFDLKKDLEGSAVCYFLGPTALVGFFSVRKTETANDKNAMYL